MQNRFRIPLIFLFIAACIGLLLRWHFILPLGWLQFPNWLHAHSHTMFLGWVFNTLFLAYLSNYSLYSKSYNILFIILQIVLIGMLISFPLQGYGIVSIVLSALHTILVFIFSWWIFSDFKKLQPTASIWFAKVSLILFTLSALGPFTLGPMVANGLGQTKWYYFSVYYYLHFQYNGVFIFGVLSLFFHTLEERQIQFSIQLTKRFGLLLLIALFPTYLLSTLWAKPGLIFNAIGFSGAVIQIISFYYFIQVIRRIVFPKVNRIVRALVIMVFFAFALKLLLQLLSAHPVIVQLAFQVRPFMIAYLHLVMIGVVTLFLLAWYLEQKIVELKFTLATKLIGIGFVGSELTLIVSGISTFHAPSLIKPSVLIIFFSFSITIGIAIFLLNSFRSENEQ